MFVLCGQEQTKQIIDHPTPKNNILNKPLFNHLQTIPAKKSAALDVEPVYTFRAHTGMNISKNVNGGGPAEF